MSAFPKQHGLLIAALMAGLLAVAAGSAIGAAKLASSAQGRSITAVRTASGIDLFTTSTTWVDVPGATATITIPAKTTGLILIQFAASARCWNSPARWCRMRAQVNGTEALPGEVTFDTSPDAGANGLGAHAMDWSTGPLPPGSYTMQLQAEVSPDQPPIFELHTGHLTVERVKV